MKIADTHTHLYFESFDTDRDNVIQQNREAGVDLQIQIGCDEVSSLAALKMAQENDDMYCTIGLHPVDIWSFMNQEKPRIYPGFENYTQQGTTLDLLSDWLDETYQKNKEHIVGFGETGIDLYHHNTPELLEQQLYSFKKHIELCKKHKKTLVIHSRGATQETLEFMRSHIKKGEIKGIWHCFSEGPEIAKTIVEEFDFYLGFGGVTTYPNAENVRDALASIPNNRIITETDSPFLVPQSKRKTIKRNESRFLTEVIESISNIKNMPIDEMSEILFTNAKKVYDLS